MSESAGSSSSVFWGDTDDTEALRRYRVLVNAIDDGIYHLDGDGRFIAVNDSIVELTGYAREELLGAHVSLLLDDDDSTTESFLTNPADRSKQLEFAVRTAEEDHVRCEVRVSPLEADDTMQGTVGIVQEITDPGGPEQPLDESDQRHNCDPTTECERSLRETKTRLEVAKSAGSVDTWSWDLHENGVTADVRLAEFSDTDSEAVTTGVPIEEFFASVHEADQERVRNRLDEAVEETGEFEVEYRITDAEGDTLWAVSRGEVEYDSSGEPSQIIGATADITERKEAEAELKRTTAEAEEQKRLYETIVSSTPDLIYAFDLEYRFTFANDAVLEMWGQTRSEAIGKTLREIGYEPWHAEMHEREIDEVIETKEPVRGEVAFPHAERGRRVYEYIFAPVLDDDGEVEAIAGTSRDVTERRRAEEKLQKNKERFRALVTASSDVVYRMSPDWNEMHELTGKAFLADTDEPTSDWLDKYIHPDEQPRVTEAIDEAIQTKSTFELEHRVEQDDGSTGWTFSRAIPMLDEDDEIEEWIGMASDITERREYQRKLEESNERLEQFAYAASHDLQEPLRMVTSYLQLLENRYADAFDEDGEEFLEYAVDGAERMREMIDALLEYSRIETRGDPFESVDLNGILEDVLADLQVQIAESGAEVTVEELPRLEGDVSQLRQLFQNLLDNAITYSGDEQPRVHVDADRRGNEWLISVEDDGIGIEPDDQERVFTVFDRLHSREEYDGTGIGLALCQRIVERHGGVIWVDSEPGEGSTFSFTLPAESEHDL
ncbi:PAS domain S-box protein [Haloterrigena sp. SYSU A121-1]|uniref:histidine kinase n=1 Tax=Haloterrigena gelatinilytica TaxID=2741724 RepID=A0A8J8GM67_9EURY|nr:PAS domain S-box protein [Haloterrigena gelatinilytica]NUB90290.1 PAS domain S-box protein [Haloterrigena gelatinilytica]